MTRHCYLDGESVEGVAGGGIPDPTAHALVDDGFGQRNSVIAVGPRGVVRS